MFTLNDDSMYSSELVQPHSLYQLIRSVALSVGHSFVRSFIPFLAGDVHGPEVASRSPVIVGGSFTAGFCDIVGGDGAVVVG